MQRVRITSLTLAVLCLLSPMATGQEDPGLLGAAGVSPPAGRVGGAVEELEGLTLAPAGLAASNGVGIPTVGASALSLSLGALATGATSAASMEEADPYRNYVAVKAGPVYFIDDLDDFNVGVNVEGIFGYRILRSLAIELVSGYFWGEDPNGVVEAEAWGVPILLQLRGSYWIRSLELYAGIGAGAYYVATKIDVGPLSDSENDWVFGGNAFLGIQYTFGRFFVGLEGKYIITDDIDAPASTTANLEAVTGMGMLGVRF